MVRVYYFIVSILFVFILAMPQPAKADTLDTIMTIVFKTIAPELEEHGKPLVKCIIIQGNSVQNCASQLAGDAATQAMSSDPKITLIVNLVTAVREPDWIKVLELTNTNFLIAISCDAAMTAIGAGPVKKFICSNLFGQVANKLDSVVREILVAIRDKDWMKLVGLAGPDLACNIIKDVVPGNDPVSNAACSVLGKVLTALSDVGGAIYDSAGNLISAVGNALDGQSPHMSYDDYYAHKFSLLPPKRALERIAHGRQGLGLDPGEWGTCVNYFDDHEQARDTAEKTCNDLGHRLGNESLALVEYVESLPQTYFDTYIKASMKPSIKDLAAELFWSDAIESYWTFVNQLPAQHWNRETFKVGKPAFFETKTGESVFYDAFKKCSFKVDDMIFGEGNGVLTYPGEAPESLVDWVCYQSAGKLYSTALINQRLWFDTVVKNEMASKGCVLQNKTRGSNSLVFRCNSFEAHLACKKAFEGYRYSHCTVDNQAAFSKLGDKLVDMLGSKRCWYSDKNQGKYDPRVVCTRPWKEIQCEQLLDEQHAQLGLNNSEMDCVYTDYKGFFEKELKKAKTILAALNSPDDVEPEGNQLEISKKDLQAIDKLKLQKQKDIAAAIIVPANCNATWDPLALNCKDSSVLFNLPKILPGTTLPICPADPNKDGADSPCYSGSYPIKLPKKEKVIISRPPQDKISIPKPGSNNFNRTVKPIKKRIPEMANLPDLTASPVFTLAGKKVRWGKATSISAKKLRPKSGGCQVLVKYGIVNNGKVMTSKTSRGSWLVGGHPPAIKIPIGKINPKSTLQGKITLTLYPGINHLTMNLDLGNRIKEQNEKNNTFNANVRLDGQCREVKLQPPIKQQIKPEINKMRPVEMRPVEKKPVKKKPIANNRISQQNLKPKAIPKPKVKSVPKPVRLSDITATSGITIAGKRVRWGASNTISATTLKPTGKGCQVPIQYGIRNLGKITNHNTSNASWSVHRHPPAISSAMGRINPGSILKKQIMLTLYPGNNRITLRLDSTNRIKEVSEKNNFFQLDVKLIGKCGKVLNRPPLKTIKPIRSIQ